MDLPDIHNDLVTFASDGLRPCLSFLADGTWSLRLGGRSLKADSLYEVVARGLDYQVELNRPIDPRTIKEADR